MSVISLAYKNIKYVLMIYIIYKLNKKFSAYFIFYKQKVSYFFDLL